MSIEKLQPFIDTRDRRLVKAGHWKNDELSETLQRLLKHGKVNVGGRASCGPKCDMSWRIFTSWCEVMKKAKSLGWVIEEIKVPQKNAYATIAGGFWQENEYVLKAQP